VHNYLLDMCSGKIKPGPIGKTSLEENYILSKLNSTIQEVTQMYESYRLNEIPQKIEDLFLELSRTYLQLTRDKGSLGSVEEKTLVASVTAKVLIETITLLAPVAPLLSEQLYQNLKKPLGLKEESIHLLMWPTADKKKIDASLETQMSIAQHTSQSILAGREKIQ